MKKPNMHYDREADVMYISFGDPKPSYAEELGDGIYARYDMDTDQLTGITIVDFSKRTRAELKSAIDPDAFNEINHYDFIH